MASATNFMSYPEANALTKTIPDTSKSLDQALETSSVFRDWYSNPTNGAWVDNFVEPILGMIGQHSIHAAGIVIAPGPITDYMPIKVQTKKKEEEKDQGEERFVITQFEGDSVEAIGLLKFDILRVRTLSHMEHSKKLIEAKKKKKINFNNINLDNPKAYIGFQKRDTQGIFQLEGNATANLLQHTKIESFEDTMAILSLSRPGTAGPGLDIEYCDRKNGKPFEFEHPIFKNLLSETFGIACVAPNTIIRGRLGDIAIKDKKDFFIEGYNRKKGRIINTKCEKIEKTGVKRKCLTLKTFTGREIVATLDQKFLWFGEYKEAKDFSVGDNLALAIPSKIKKGKDAINEAMFVGYLLANGCINSKQWNFTTKDIQLKNDFIKLIKILFKKTINVNVLMQIRDVFRVSCSAVLPRKNPATKFLIELGLLKRGGYGATGSLKSSDKFIPSFFKNKSLKTKEALVRAMYRCDGTKSQAVYSTTSKQMAKDYASYLSDCGVLSYNYYSDCYRVMPLNVDRFSEIIGYSIPAVCTEKINIGHRKKIIDYCSKNNISQAEYGRRNSIPFLKNIIHRKSLLRRSLKWYKNKDLSSSDIWWDRIVSIKECYSDVYDIINSGTGNFIANDIIASNCYQEQVMQVFSQLGKLSLVEADKFRKIMKKKDVSAMTSYREKFFNGCIKNGITKKEDREKFWEQIASWSSYGFCLPFNQKIITANGKIIKIGDLKKKIEKGNKVLLKSLNKKGEIINNEVISFFDNGKKEIVEIKTEDGLVFRCTEDHKFLTRNGYRKIKDIIKDNLEFRVIDFIFGFIFYFDKVKKVKKIGVQKVCDIEMRSPNNNFILDSGVVAHNCKSHAAAYAQLSIWTMVIKQKFPLEFYVGWLNNPKDKDQIVRIYSDLKRKGISVRFPDVNVSKDVFTEVNGEIIWALKGIKQIGADAAKVIADNAPYSSMEDFMKKIKGKKITKRHIDPLISINAFPFYKTVLETATEYYRIRKEEVPATFTIKSRKHWNKNFYSYTGFYKENPVLVYEKELKPFGKMDTFGFFKEANEGDGIKLAGYITEFREIHSKRGLMAVLKIEVDYEAISVVVWSSFYPSCALAIKDKADIIGCFCFIFGEKSEDNRGIDQVQIGNVNEDYLEIL